MRKGTLLKNAIILTVTSFILRSLGMFLRSYMSNKIGAEGMGLYQLIISIYVLATTLVTAGISTAITKLISDAYAKNESESKIKKIMQKALLIAILCSFIVVLLFFILAKPIGLYWLKDARCILSIKILLIALPFISVSSCIRSYFLAKRRVLVNSLSQLIEQFIRMIAIFIFLEIYNVSSLEIICMYIICGDIISEILACFYIYYKYKKEMKEVNNKHEKSFKLKDFYKIAFPVAINRYISSILRTIENILIPNKLALYTLSSGVALEQFGYIKGMALPLIFFPASFLTALSSLLMPEAAEASTLKQNNKINRLVEKTFYFTLSCSIVIASIFFIYSKEIGYVFYSNNEISFYIKSLAPLIPFMYMESAIVGMMQGLNQQRKTLKYNIIDSIIRITLIVIILPKTGINGFIFIMYISNIITSSLNMFRLLKVSKTKFNITWVLKPILAAILACMTCYTISLLIVIKNEFIAVSFKIFVILVIYMILVNPFKFRKINE